MLPSINQIKHILLEQNYITEADNRAAEAESADTREYVDYLVRNELLSQDLLGQAIAEAYHLPYADLKAEPVTVDQVREIPEKIAQEHRVVLLRQTSTSVEVATDYPSKKSLQAVHSALFKRKKLYLFYTLPEYIDDALTLYDQPLDTRFTEILKENKKVASELVDEILKDATKFRVSDIHFQPQHDEVHIRFRIDGALREAGAIPKEQYENVLNRIKIESGMRIDEHQNAQDGTMQFIEGNLVTDLRVSLIPTVLGEKVVMRVLRSHTQGFTLKDIGLSDKNMAYIEEFSKKPFGMIVAAGPTGSGKTTTLYGILRLLNKPSVNITTIEDPVELRLPGISQIPVREHAGLTFAKGLRSIVRQDPDIILVGEVRDEETAEISVNAALTGHLLLTSFHANNAATAIPRLMNMGVEPFLLASTLQVVVAQRLVRQLCRHCRYSVPINEALAGLSNGGQFRKYFSPHENVYQSKGCAVCNSTGYYGRTAVFEVIAITPALQELIMREPSAQQIMAGAAKEGFTTMFEDGIDKVKQGVTSLEEVLRIAEAPKPKEPQATV